jgi:hypothetical protein
MIKKFLEYKHYIIKILYINRINYIKIYTLFQFNARI